MTSDRPTVLVVGALPPPTHGVTVVIERILHSHRLAERFRIVHADISDHRDLTNVGRVDVVNLLLAVRHWFALVAALVRHRPALVHIPLAQNRLGLLRDWVLLVTTLATRRRVLCHVAGGAFGSSVSNSPWWLKRPVSAAIRRSSAMLASSEWHKTSLERAFPGVPVLVVRRGTEEIDVERTERGDGALRVLYASSFLTEDKGLFVALEAARAAAASAPRLDWRIVGSFVSEADRSRASAMVDGLPAVSMVGELPREELLRAYEDADVFVFPTSGQEAFGLVRIEAMAAGLPVITTHAGGAAEVIREGVDGFIVDYDSPERIASLLDELARDRKRLAEMSREAQARQRALFSMETFEKRLGDVWRRLIETA